MSKLIVATKSFSDPSTAPKRSVIPCFMGPNFF